MSKIECPNCKNQSDEDTWVEAMQKHKCPACTAWIPEKKYKAIVRKDATPREEEKEGELHIRRIPAAAPATSERGGGSAKIIGTKIKKTRHKQC